jgi:sensor histidine kinase YesM
MIPVMLLQPYIENAIWHGILPLESMGHLEIAIRKNGEGILEVTITDNGVGRQESSNTKPKTHISRGMQLTQQRLELLSRLTDKELSISITDAYPAMKNKGTNVTIILPATLE